MFDYEQHNIRVGQEYSSRITQSVIVVINVETYAQAGKVIVYDLLTNHTQQLPIHDLLLNYCLNYEVE